MMAPSPQRLGHQDDLLRDVELWDPMEGQPIQHGDEDDDAFTSLVFNTHRTSPSPGMPATGRTFVCDNPQQTEGIAGAVHHHHGSTDKPHLGSGYKLSRPRVSLSPPSVVTKCGTVSPQSIIDMFATPTTTLANSPSPTFPIHNITSGCPNQFKLSPASTRLHLLGPSLSEVLASSADVYAGHLQSDSPAAMDPPVVLTRKRKSHERKHHKRKRKRVVQATSRKLEQPRYAASMAWDSLLQLTDETSSPGLPPAPMDDVAIGHAELDPDSGTSIKGSIGSSAHTGASLSSHVASKFEWRRGVEPEPMNPAQRKVAIRRYLLKRERRQWKKKTQYASRRRCATERQRSGGRFVSTKK